MLICEKKKCCFVDKNAGESYKAKCFCLEILIWRNVILILKSHHLNSTIYEKNPNKTKDKHNVKSVTKIT